MENMTDIMSKFKNNLDNVITDYKNKISDIEKEEEFIVTLGDVVNYSKSDCLLLPFYDETILSRVFERVFPLSESEMSKIKSAKYLFEASKNIDKNNFPQYNDSVKDIESIYDKLSKYYDKLLSDDNLKKSKEDYSNNIEKYSKIFDIILDDKFNFIDDVDLFEEAINICGLSDDEINVILNVAIRCNLDYLDSNGLIVETEDDDIIGMKEQNNKFQVEIDDLSNLLSDE